MYHFRTLRCPVKTRERARAFGADSPPKALGLPAAPDTPKLSEPHLNCLHHSLGMASYPYIQSARNDVILHTHTHIYIYIHIHIHEIKGGPMGGG